MGNYEHLSDEDLAADVITFIHTGREIVWSDWGNWRRSKEPYYDRKEEARALAGLRDHECLDTCLSPNHLVELSKEGRKAAKFKGGPLAYWEDQRKAQEEIRSANRAKISDTKWNKRFLVINGLFTLASIAMGVYTFRWSATHEANAVKEHEARYHNVEQGHGQVSPERPVMPSDTVVPQAK